MAEYDLVGIGNALVDVIADAPEAFLARHDLPKGGMKLINAEEAGALYAAMPPGVECSGGSCGNTMAGFASLGGKGRSEEHTSELQSLMRISYAVFCLKKKKQ